MAMPGDRVLGVAVEFAAGADKLRDAGEASTAGSAGAPVGAGDAPEGMAGSCEADAAAAGCLGAPALLPPPWKSFWKSIGGRGVDSLPAKPTTFCLDSLDESLAASTEPKRAGLSPWRCSPEVGCTAGEEERAALESWTDPKLIPPGPASKNESKEPVSTLIATVRTVLEQQISLRTDLVLRHQAQLWAY